MNVQHSGSITSKLQFLKIFFGQAGPGRINSRIEGRATGFLWVLKS